VSKGLLLIVLLLCVVVVFVVTILVTTIIVAVVAVVIAVEISKREEFWKTKTISSTLAVRVSKVSNP